MKKKAKKAEPEKRAPGRPKGSGMAGGKRRTLYLDEATWEELRVIGEETGSLGGGDGRSAAVRRLAADHRAAREA